MKKKRILAVMLAVTVCVTGLAGNQTAKAAENKTSADGVLTNELTAEAILANDYVLYLENCGTPDASVIPDGYQQGIMQSGVDQVYGVDAVTGYTWGSSPADANSQIVAGGSDAADLAATYVYMSEKVTFDKEKSGLRYSFEMPENVEGIRDEYRVIVGFQNPWSARSVNIQLEGATVETGLSLTQNTLIEKSYKVTVSDGELNVMVHNPNRTSQYGDPIVNYIIVYAIPSDKLDMLKALIEKQEGLMEGKSYGETGLNAYKQVKEQAQTLIDEASQDETAIETLYGNLQSAYEGLKEIVTYTSITGTAGAQLRDNNGELIQAHGGQIQKLTVDGVTKWYWIGEDKTNNYRPVGGIHLYTSDDLYNWTDEGVVLRTMESEEEFETDEYFKNLYGDYTDEKKAEIFVDLDKNKCVIERPKMLYNEKTGKYVIWFHADGITATSSSDYGKAKAGIAVADSPTGPFKLLGSYKLAYSTAEDANHNWDSEESAWGAVRDMNVFQDDDGTAYVIYSSDGNATTYIAKMNEEYTGIVREPGEAVEGVDFTRAFIDQSREAPAMFKYKDKYYMINSGTSGWNPNPAKYAVADDPMGPWTLVGNPCVDEEASTTYRSQSTCVIPIDPENGEYIYMGDRWNEGLLSDSRYVWCPIEFLPGEKIAIRNAANWTLDALHGNGAFEIKATLPEYASSTATLLQTLPGQIDVDFGNGTEKTAVAWGGFDASERTLGTIDISGYMSAKERIFSHTMSIVDPRTVYFFDSGTETSDYYSLVQSVLGKQLRNTVPDQKYTEANGAGYTGVTKTENESSFDIAAHSGTGLMETGWWASGSKNIQYAFQLEAGNYTVATGYQEWWSTSRATLITVSADGETLASQKFTLASADQKRQENVNFTLAKDAKVLVTISKTGNPDPVLSWIAVLKDANQMKYQAAEGGTLTGTAVQLIGADTKGTAVTAVAGTGYTFVQWSDGVKAAARSDTGAVENVTVTAQFAKQTFVLTYRAAEGGTISKNASQTVAYGGDGVAVTATARSGYKFVKWSDGIKSAARTDKNIRANKTVTAEFEKITTKVTLDTAKLTLGVKETYTLTAKAAPSDASSASKKITWKSSNTSIASVSGSGKITAKKTGTVKITATTGSGKTAVCTITVKKAPAKVTLNVTKKTLSKNKTYQIKTTLPKNTASSTIIYSSSNKKIATVSSTGKIKALKKGTATIIVKTYNGKKATLKITVR